MNWIRKPKDPTDAEAEIAELTKKAGEVCHVLICKSLAWFHFFVEPSRNLFSCALHDRYFGQ